MYCYRILVDNYNSLLSFYNCIIKTGHYLPLTVRSPLLVVPKFLTSTDKKWCIGNNASNEGFGVGESPINKESAMQIWEEIIARKIIHHPKHGRTFDAPCNSS